MDEAISQQTIELIQTDNKKDNTMIWKEVCLSLKTLLNKSWLLFWSVSFPVVCCACMYQKTSSSIVVTQGFKWDKYFSMELIFSQKGQRKETSNDRIYYVQRQTIFSSSCWKWIYGLRNTNMLNIWLRNTNILNRSVSNQALETTSTDCMLWKAAENLKIKVDK